MDLLITSGDACLWQNKSILYRIMQLFYNSVLTRKRNSFSFLHKWKFEKLIIFVNLIWAFVWMMQLFYYSLLIRKEILLVFYKWKLEIPFLLIAF